MRAMPSVSVDSSSHDSRLLVCLFAHVDNAFDRATSLSALALLVVEVEHMRHAAFA